MPTLDLDSARWSALVRHSMRVTGNRPDAEDAVQDAALAVLRRLPALDPQTTDIGAYLHVAAHHAALRLRSRRTALADRQGDVEPVADPAAPVDELVARRAMRAELRAAVDRIPPRQREALLLFDVAGMDGTQVGARLGLAPNAVNQLVFRARRSMRVHLSAAN